MIARRLRLRGSYSGRNFLPRLICKPGSLLGRVVLACAMAICAGCYNHNYSEPAPGALADCGAASDGLAVMLKSGNRPAQGGVRVANRHLDASMGSEDKSKVSVQGDGAVWACRERMSDTNPLTECVMQAESPRRGVAGFLGGVGSTVRRGRRFGAPACGCVLSLDGACLDDAARIACLFGSSNRSR